MTVRILIVDDDEAFRRLLVGALRHEYAIEQAASGEDCLRALQVVKPDIVLLDIMMPGIDGYETCRRIKSTSSNVPVQVIMVSAHSSREEQMRAYEMGADDYLVKPVDLQELRSRMQLHSRLHEAAQNVVSIRQEIDSRNTEIRRLAAQRTEELLLTQDVAIFTLAKVAESRDQITGGHLLRVRAYSQLLAEELHREGPYCRHVDAHFLENLYRASPLHDIGKVGITDAILTKPDRLSSEELERMQEHAVMGANILDQAVGQSSYAGFLSMAACVARFHHERFDGTGYPAGLVGEEIPLPARIVALADVYDAITSERPYKAAQPASHARQVIQSESGHQFDPVIVHAFQNRFAEFLQIRQSQLDAMPLVIGAMSFRKRGNIMADS